MLNVVVVADACPPGTYSTGSQCAECPLDTYQDRDGATSCQPCPVGTYTSRLAARNVTECTGLILVMRPFCYKNASFVALCPPVRPSVCLTDCLMQARYVEKSYES